MQAASVALQHDLCSKAFSRLAGSCTASLISLASFVPSHSIHASLQWQADGLGGVTSGPVDIFDRDAKRAHRERAAWLCRDIGEDPLQAEVSERLVDRLDDCRRTFPAAAVLGGACDAVVRRLGDGRAGIETLLVLDSSRAMLQRVARQQREQQVPQEGPSGAPSAQQQPQQQRPRVHYVEADEETLPLRDSSLDLIISSLSLHWVNDLPGCMAQCRHALKPDGLFLAALWGGDTLQELRIAHALAEQECEGGLSPRISPLAQVRDAGNLLTRAGLAIPSVDTDEITVHYRHPAQLTGHLRRMGEGNAVRARRPLLRRGTAARADEIYASRFGAEDGSVPATFQIIYMTGWSPHEAQQRAMPRGSATVSFEDLQAKLGERKAGGT